MRLYRTQPETDQLAASTLRLAQDIERCARSGATTTKTVLERAEEQTARLVADARALRMAIRGELQRIRADERVLERREVVPLVNELASTGEVCP